MWVLADQYGCLQNQQPQIPRACPQQRFGSCHAGQLGAFVQKQEGRDGATTTCVPQRELGVRPGGTSLARISSQPPSDLSRDLGQRSLLVLCVGPGKQDSHPRRCRFKKEGRSLWMAGDFSRLLGGGVGNPEGSQVRILKRRRSALFSTCRLSPLLSREKCSHTRAQSPCRPPTIKVPCPACRESGAPSWPPSPPCWV